MTGGALVAGSTDPSPAQNREPRRGRGRRHPAWPLAVAAGCIVAVFVLSIALGAVRLTPGEVVDGLLGRGDELSDQIVRNVRLPRALLALMLGSALGVAGLLLQQITRNPLADPQILGFSNAGALAAVLVTIQFPDLPVDLLPPAAIVGALVGAVVVFASAGSGSAAPVRLALAGVMLASLFTSFTALFLVTSDLTTQAALGWVAGGFFGRGWDHWRAAWPYCLAGLAAAAILVRNLNILALGDDSARSLGLRVGWIRVSSAVTAAALTGAAVAVGGQIAFVGLIAPHVARLLIGSDLRLSLMMSAMVGAVLLGLSDVVARTVIAPTEVPIGVVTATLGVPFFIYLLRRSS